MDWQWWDRSKMVQNHATVQLAKKSGMAADLTGV
jgi:hypothetical protein